MRNLQGITADAFCPPRTRSITTTLLGKKRYGKRDVNGSCQSTGFGHNWEDEISAANIIKRLANFRQLFRYFPLWIIEIRCEILTGGDGYQECGTLCHENVEGEEGEFWKEGALVGRDHIPIRPTSKSSHQVETPSPSAQNPLHDSHWLRCWCQIPTLLCSGSHSNIQPLKKRGAMTEWWCWWVNLDSGNKYVRGKKQYAIGRQPGNKLYLSRTTPYLDPENGNWIKNLPKLGLLLHV